MNKKISILIFMKIFFLYLPQNTHAQSSHLSSGSYSSRQTSPYSSSQTIVESEELPDFKGDEKIILTLDDLRKIVLKKDFTVRKEAEKVYIAQERIKVEMGQLLPQIHFVSIYSVALASYLFVIPSLVGFLFPGNWFLVKESMLFFEGQKRQFGVVQANEINKVENTYYQIATIKNLMHIYERVLDLANNILLIAKEMLRSGQLTYVDYLRFENFVLNLENDLIVFYTVYYRALFHLVDFIGIYPESLKIPNIELAEHDIKGLSKTKHLDIEDYYKIAIGESWELDALRYMIKAARYATYNRVFEFFTPDSSPESSFGFGYGGYINITRSGDSLLRIRYQEAFSQIMNAADKNVAIYNATIDSYKKSKQGLLNAQAWYDSLLEQFHVSGSFSVELFLRSLESMLQFEGNIVIAKQYFLMSRSNLERLLWKKEVYKKIRKKSLKDHWHTAKDKEGEARTYNTLISWVHSIKRGFEDRKIKKHLKKGKLKMEEDKNEVHDKLLEELKSKKYSIHNRNRSSANPLPSDLAVLLRANKNG